MIVDADEHLHPVGSDSEHWSDSLYFNAWDPATGTFLMTRMAVRPNEGDDGVRTAGMLVWSDGVPSWGYGRDLTGPPTSNWDVMTMEGLTYRMEQSLQRWVVQLRDGDDQAHLVFEGVTPCVDYGADIPRAWAWGHYEQTCRVTGDLRVGGRSIGFDGWGQRDHSWGARDWAGLREWHWITGFLLDPADGSLVRSFNAFEATQADGTVSQHGFDARGGEVREITSFGRTLAREGAPASYVVSLPWGDVSGTSAGMAVPVRPHAGDTVVHEAPMRLTTDDGLEGFGIYELLENP